MVRNRDSLLGVPQRDPGAAPLAKGWLRWAAILAVLVAIASAYLLGRVARSDTQAFAPPDAEAGATPNPPKANPTAASGAAPKPEDLAVSADFIITDRLLANLPDYEQLQGATMQTSVCLGDPLHVANAANVTVGLVDTPEDSDAAVELGIIKPGGVFRLKPREVGVFYLSAAGRDGLLFRYEVEKCTPKT